MISLTTLAGVPQAFCLRSEKVEEKYASKNPFKENFDLPQYYYSKMEN